VNVEEVILSEKSPIFFPTAISVPPSVA